MSVVNTICLDEIQITYCSTGRCAQCAHKSLEENDDLNILVETLFWDCKDSPMASYHISFMEMVETLTPNIHSLRTLNWNEFIFSLRDMLPWIAVYDNGNYGRLLPHFVAMLDSLTGEQEQYMKEGLF